MRRITAGVVVLLLAAGCSSGDGSGAGPTTTAPSTTLPPSSTSTTLPPRSVTEVDVCALPHSNEMDAVLEEAGFGEVAPVEEGETDGGVPAFVTGTCSWPSADDPAIALTYLAPTTATDGVQHLEDVLASDTGFAEGGQVLQQEARDQVVGVLVDAEGMVRELAVVRGSALAYLVVDQELSARDEEAVAAYADLLVTALNRAPR